jgi:CRP-like cAMP-binding protein
LNNTGPTHESLLEKIQQWQRQRQQTIKPDRKQTELQLARLILDLARDQPELVQLKAVSAEQSLITEAVEHHSVYLVLSGELYVYRYGERLHDAGGNPVRVAAGSILGEIAALHGGIASATVAGNAVVLSLTQTVFRQSVEALAGYRVL